MAIAFVQNYQDLSTDRGYQFKFHCDHCGNGYMTSFQTSVIGAAESVLKIAGDLFGGAFSHAGESAYEVQRMVGGTAHDKALAAAVDECKQHFHQCPRCGKWVCPEVCWNGAANLCKGCAPRFEEELAAAHADARASAARQQLQSRAAGTDYVANVDMRGVASAAPVAPAASAGPHCTECGTLLGTAKFCPQCGTPRPAQAPAACSCGAPIAPGTKFCGECGKKLG
jgi:membrane protease subunit (stomatin/prohibitin family)